MPTLNLLQMDFFMLVIFSSCYIYFLGIYILCFKICVNIFSWPLANPLSFLWLVSVISYTFSALGLIGVWSFLIFIYFCFQRNFQELYIYCSIKHYQSFCCWFLKFHGPHTVQIWIHFSVFSFFFFFWIKS